MAAMTSAIPFPALVVGLMSGTSADGVDAAILRTDGRAVVESGPSHFTPYSDKLRAQILALMRGEGNVTQVAGALTDVHIDAVNELLKEVNIKREDIALVGFHGQTIRHAPEKGITVQIGEPQRMAAELRIPVVADFRTADVKAGGHGAPLVPLYHAALAKDLPKPLMVVNIGGVSNVTWLGEAGEIIAFDSGPGSGLIDDWMQKHAGTRFDKDGEAAARGMSNAGLVQEFLQDEYFLRAAPKSLDRNHFVELVNGLVTSQPMSVEDGAATLTSMSALAIARSFDAVPLAPKQVLITGGGRHNVTMMGMLKACVNAPVLPVEQVGWNGDMLEAEAFAYLAARSVQGLPLSLPTTTGVKAPQAGGQLFKVAA
jgi:anhydro-N-acetylmuramic acid kinase